MWFEHMTFCSQNRRATSYAILRKKTVFMKKNLFKILNKNSIAKLKKTNAQQYLLETLKTEIIRHIVQSNKKTQLEKIQTQLTKTEFYVRSILLISFSKSNTNVTLLTSSGKILFSQSAGCVGLVGKQKRNRQLAVRQLLRLLKEKLDILFPNEEFLPISLQLSRVGSSKQALIKLASSFFVISSLKLLNLTPFNGCRKKKLKRKKFTPILKR